MKKSKELKISIGYQPVFDEVKENPFSEEFIVTKKTIIRGFTCAMLGNVLAGKYDFYIIPDRGRLVIYPYLSLTPETSPVKRVSRPEGAIAFEYQEDFDPIRKVIESYQLTEEEHKTIDGYLGPMPVPETMPQEALEYFGGILSKILEGAGYTIIGIAKYFPSPTSMAIVTPVFSLGRQRDVKPENIKDDSGEQILTYLSYTKPQSKAEIQLKLLDNIPQERIGERERMFKDSLSPYGLKTLYLVMEECANNNRFPWFSIDTNRCLDLLGYKRNKKRVHQSTNKERFLKSIQDLTLINFTVEKRTPKKVKAGVDQAMRITRPLLSITGKWEEFEVKKDQPIEKGIKIKEGMQIFIHPEIYKFIDRLYTFIPHEFLKIDITRNPHAVAIYSYIANQWRIGLHEHGGTIRVSMRTLLDGIGLLTRLLKRKNKQREVVEKIKDNLHWLKSQKEFWIKSVRFDTKNRTFLEQLVTIEMEKNHPLLGCVTNTLKLDETRHGIH